MARPAFTTAGAFVLLLAMSSPALAEPLCSGVVITDVIEGASGGLIPVGVQCYEPGPGAPYYYDAPIDRSRAWVETTPSSITHFDATDIQALGAQPISDLVNPFPAGQGDADSRQE